MANSTKLLVGSAWAISDPAVAFALKVFFTHRLLLFALGAFLAPIAPIIPPLGDSLLREVDPFHWGLSYFLLGPWQRWDTNWYIQIAQQGYTIGTGTTNFPPLYPLSVGMLGRLLLGQYMLAALIISSLAYIAALTYFYRLSLVLFKDEEVSRRGVLWLAGFPTAFFMASGYTESLYLALVLAAFYYGEKKQWAIAAALAALASVTRLQGVILLIPLGYLYWEQRRFDWRKANYEAILLMIAPLPLLAYMAYVYLILGDAGFSTHLSVIWHIQFVMPWDSLMSGTAGLFDPNQARNLFYNIFDYILITLFVCLAIIWWQRGLPRTYLIYTVLSMCLFLTRQGTDGLFWMSINRYLLAIFPVFMLAGLIMPTYLLKYSVAVQAFWASLFIFWMWAG